MAVLDFHLDAGSRRRERALAVVRSAGNLLAAALRERVHRTGGPVDHPPLAAVRVGPVCLLMLAAVDVASASLSAGRGAVLLPAAVIGAGPMGPLRLTDLVGLDVRLAIAEHLERELGARFEPPQLLRDKVARGELGRKAGRGFYEWS